MLSALDRLIAHEEIRQLAARYALALDSRDLDTFVGLYVDDVAVAPGRSGRDALREMVEELIRPVAVSILNVGTHVIDVIDEDHATGSVYCKAELHLDGRWVHQAILYSDRYERRSGRWYFAKRAHRLWYGIDAGVRPFDQPPANWPVNQIGRGTLPEHWETWRAWARGTGHGHLATPATDVGTSGS